MRGYALLLALISAPACAADEPWPQDFNALFAATCMTHFYAQDALRADMERRKVPEVPAEARGFFLGGGAGKAWLVVTPKERYVVSLREDSQCSVFARHADPDSVHAGFKDLVATAPSPMQAAAQDASELGPNRADTKTVAYAWSRPQDKDQLLFVLTTSTSTEVTAQAMASMSLVGKTD